MGRLASWVESRSRVSVRDRRTRRFTLEALEERQLLTVDFDYVMAPRFGLDLNHNGLIDLPNTATYAQVSSFQFTLTVSGDTNPDPTVDYKWSLQPPGGGQPVVISRLASQMQSDPPTLSLGQGVYTTTFQRFDNGQPTDTLIHPVSVRDILIVSIGDSYSSGEANPEVVQQFTTPSWLASPEYLRTADLNDLIPGSAFIATAPFMTQTAASVWADGADGYYGPGPYDGVPGHEPMNAENADAHRSTLCATAQYALALEQQDPHSSVTYIQVAQSGATILSAMGLATIPGKVTGMPMPNQLDELQRIIGTRKADQFFMSLGGNDVQFAPVARALVSLDLFSSDPVGDTTVYQPAKIQKMLANVLAQANQSSSFVKALKLFQSGYATLPQRYAALNMAMKNTYHLNTQDVYITEYPDPTRIYQTMYDPKLNTSRPIPWWGSARFDVVPGFGTNATTIYLVSQLIVKPLDQAVATAAASNGWTEITGISNAFLGHGYDAPLNGTATTSRFIRTARESVVFQGPPGLSGLLDTSGILHPNAAGHQAIKTQILAALTPSKVAVRATTVAGQTVLTAIPLNPHATGNRGARYDWQFEKTPGNASFLSDANGQRIVLAGSNPSVATLRITNRNGVHRDVFVVIGAGLGGRRPPRFLPVA
ncbi:MAG: hypothetical protein U0794_21905 [Isosphaeraceae bacterium]